MPDDDRLAAAFAAEDATGVDEDAPEDEDGEDGGFDIYWRAPLRSDPWKRWPIGAEPIHELDIVYIDADASTTSLVRYGVIEVEPGVIPDPRPHNPYGEHDDDFFDLHFVSRWNATWRGARLTELSLDMFSQQWPEVLRLVLDPASDVELLCAYNASYAGFWGLHLCNHGTSVRNAHDEPLGHHVACRDPRLALRIAARYPGIATHFAGLQTPLWHPKEPTSDDGRKLIGELREAAQRIAAEPLPGAHAVMQEDTLKALTTVLVDETEPPPTISDPFAASLDTYTLIATSGLVELIDADLLRADRTLVGQLAAHVNFPDAVAAVRRSDPDRLPLWIDFTDEQGEPMRRRQAAGIEQPLYGALVNFEDSEEYGKPFHTVVLIGRTSGLIEEALPLCVLGIGPDDRWRFPMAANQISVLTAHSGGVAVRHLKPEWEYHGIEPPITDHELSHELSRVMQRMTEWALGRVGAVLSALDDGLLLTQRRPGATATYDLVRAPTGPEAARSSRPADAMTIARRLRELGSLHRVSEKIGVDVPDAYRALDLAGIDPDQVLRDEVLLRWRRTASIEAVITGTHLHRDLVERYLLEAGLDPTDTPIPHDVTDPDVLAAVAAYRQAGTLDAAGEQLGISGETVRRRIARAGLTTDEIETEVDRREEMEAVDAWERAGRSLAGAARELGIDPRTVKERLRRADVPLDVVQDTNGHRREEVIALYEQVGSRQAVAALLGVSLKTVKEALRENQGDGGGPTSPVPSPLETGRSGRPKVSDAELTRAVLAVAHHGSVRAGARALGMSTGGMAHRLRQARERGLVDDNDNARRGPGKED